MTVRVRSKRFRFSKIVRKEFSFLTKYGFVEVESLSSTIVRYRKEGLDLNVYWGRKSYEIGFGFSWQGNHYSLSELIRAADPAAKQYRNQTGTTPEEVAGAVAMVAELVKLYGRRMLQSDPTFFEALEEEKETWAEEYALDVLEQQVRPKAEIAFRNRDYRRAVEYYGMIRCRLSASELKKLELAKRRSGR